MTDSVRKQEEKRQNYAALMEAIKARLDVVQFILNNGKTMPLNEDAAQELCWLQLRMIGETISAACLLAHDDLQNKRLQGEWNANNIIATLGNLHAEFFPRPVKREHLADGTIHMNSVPDGFLTRDELLKLIGQAGNKLHIGSLKNLFEKKPLPQDIWDEIRTWNNKIVLLLQEHFIKFRDNSVYYIALKEAIENNKVLFVLAAPQAVGL